jgi:hypothetical protein
MCLIGLVTGLNTEMVYQYCLKPLRGVSHSSVLSQLLRLAM